MSEWVIFVFRKWKFCGDGGFTLNSLCGQGTCIHEYSTCTSSLWNSTILKISCHGSCSPRMTVVHSTCCLLLLFCRGKLENVQQFVTYTYAYCSVPFIKSLVLCHSYCHCCYGVLKLKTVHVNVQCCTVPLITKRTSNARS